jgi:hypothetical protein
MAHRAGEVNSLNGSADQVEKGQAAARRGRHRLAIRGESEGPKVLS